MGTLATCFTLNFTYDATGPRLTSNLNENAATPVNKTQTLQVLKIMGECSEQNAKVDLKLNGLGQRDELEVSDLCDSLGHYQFLADLTAFSEGSIAVFLAHSDSAGNQTTLSRQLIK